MPGMMEKGPELLGKNRSANGSAKSPAGGGGSGASSTNGGLHFSEPESGCSSDDEHGDVGMRVGAEYQARIPEFDPDLPNFYLISTDCLYHKEQFCVVTKSFHLSLALASVAPLGVIWGYFKSQ
uniref:REST corepressor 3 n=1 Tax=Molossus molossus TaxID=27622 RepID=A0A7J8CTT0_MOLMO|nr:REST corepressor 3 [Molossus molossus]